MQSPVVSIDIRYEDAVLSRILNGFSTSRATILMGGAARSLHSGEDVKDYDFAFGSESGRDEFIAHLRTIGAVKVAETFNKDNELTCEDFVYRWGDLELEYTYIQVKREFYHTPEELFATADLTIVQFCLVIDGKGRRLLATIAGIDDHERRFLRIHNVWAPESTMIRVVRFSKRGYVPYHTSSFYAELIHAIKQCSRVQEPALKKYASDWRERLNIPKELP